MRIPKTLYKILLRLVIYSLVLVVALALSLPMILNHFVKLEKIKPDIEKGLTEYFQRRVTINHLEWNWFPRPALSGHKVAVFENDDRILAESPQVSIYPKLRHLINKEIYIESLDVLNPTFELRRFKDGSFNFTRCYQDMQKSQKNVPSDSDPSGTSFVLRSFSLDNANIDVFDESLVSPQLTPTVTADVTFDIPVGSAPFTMDLAGLVTHHKLQGSIKAVGAFGDDVSLSIKAKNLPLSALSDYLPKLENVAGRFQINGTVKTHKGRAVWDFVGFTDKVRPAQASDFPMDVQAKFATKTSHPLNAELLLEGTDTQGTVRFSWPDAQKPVYFVGGDFQSVNVDEVLLLKKFITARSTVAPGALKQKSKAPENWVIHSTITAKQLLYQGKILNNLDITLMRTSSDVWKGSAAFESASINQQTLDAGYLSAEWQDHTLSVPQVKLQAFGGWLEASGTWRELVTSSTTGSFKLDWQAQKIGFAPLQKVLRLDYQTTGRVTSDGSLVGTTPQFLSPQLNGTLQCRISSGTVSGLKGLVKFLASFNMKSLLTDVKGKGPQGLPFSVLKGTFSVVNGTLQTLVPVKIESPTVDIAAQGSINLMNTSMMGDAVVQFLNPVDETINMVPGTQTILMNGQKTFLPIWVKFSGRLGNPNLKVQTLKSIGKKTWNTFMSVLKIPGNMIGVVTDMREK